MYINQERSDSEWQKYIGVVKVALILGISVKIALNGRQATMMSLIQNRLQVNYVMNAGQRKVQGIAVNSIVK